MVEVPSAALLAERLAESVDFLSIGTNDLTQYVLGAERGNTLLSEFQDALHPAVLRLIKGVVEAGRVRGRHVSVCGDAASEPVAAAVFFGLGIRSLSVRPNQVPEIKAGFRQLRASELTPLATLALEARNAAEARRPAEQLLKRNR
jgi:phosphoenolpyruvate-protein kinase (PTS system EI component)